MRRLLFAPNYRAAVKYAQQERWQNSSWTYLHDLGDVVGVPKGTPVVILPNVELHPHHAEIRRALERRPVQITYVTAPTARIHS